MPKRASHSSFAAPTAASRSRRRGDVSSARAAKDSTLPVKSSRSQLSDLSPAALSAARQAMARVKARRSAESAVFLRDMLERRMEYDDISPSKDAAGPKLLRNDYSLPTAIFKGETPKLAHEDPQQQSRASAVHRGDPLAVPRGFEASSSTVEPRGYLFEDSEDSSATSRRRTLGDVDPEDVDVDYIRQLAAEEHAGLSAYSLFGVARKLDDKSGDAGKGDGNADLVFALEQARSETVLWKAKEELARSSVSRDMSRYRDLTEKQRLTLEELQQGMELDGGTPSRAILGVVANAVDQARALEAGLEQSLEQLASPQQSTTPDDLVASERVSQGGAAIDVASSPPAVSPGTPPSALVLSPTAPQGSPAGPGGRGGGGTDPKNVVAMALDQARNKVETLQHRISKTLLAGAGGSGEGARGLRALEAELAVEQRLMASLEAAFSVCDTGGNGPGLGASGSGASHASGPKDAHNIDQIKQLDATIQMLVARLQAQTDRPVRAQHQLTKEKRLLQTRVAALERSQQESRAAADRYQRMGDKAASSVVRLRAENTRLKSEAEKHAKEARSALDQVTMLRNQTVSAQGVLDQSRIELDSLRAKVAQLEAQLQRERQKVDNSESLAIDHGADSQHVGRRECEGEFAQLSERARDGLQLKLQQVDGLKKRLDVAASVDCIPNWSSGADVQQRSATLPPVRSDEEVRPVRSQEEQAVLQQLYRELEANQRNMVDFLLSGAAGFGVGGIASAGDAVDAPGGGDGTGGVNFEDGIEVGKMIDGKSEADLLREQLLQAETQLKQAAMHEEEAVAVATAEATRLGEELERMREQIVKLEMGKSDADVALTAAKEAENAIQCDLARAKGELAEIKSVLDGSKEEHVLASTEVVTLRGQLASLTASSEAQISALLEAAGSGEAEVQRLQLEIERVQADAAAGLKEAAAVHLKERAEWDTERQAEEAVWREREIDWEQARSRERSSLQDELQIRKDALAKCQTDVVAMQSAIQSLESEAFVHVQQLEREREQLLGRLEVAERAVERGANMHDVLDAARSAAEVRAQNAEERGAELGRELAEAKEEAASSAAQVSSMHARLQSLEKAEQGLLAKVSALEEMGEEANAVADRAREQGEAAHALKEKVAALEEEVTTLRRAAIEKDNAMDEREKLLAENERSVKLACDQLLAENERQHSSRTREWAEMEADLKSQLEASAAEAVVAEEARAGLQRQIHELSERLLVAERNEEAERHRLQEAARGAADREDKWQEEAAIQEARERVLKEELALREVRCLEMQARVTAVESECQRLSALVAQKEAMLMEQGSAAAAESEELKAYAVKEQTYQRELSEKEAALAEADGRCKSLKQQLAEKEEACFRSLSISQEKESLVQTLKRELHSLQEAEREREEAPAQKSRDYEDELACKDRLLEEKSALLVHAQQKYAELQAEVQKKTQSQVLEGALLPPPLAETQARDFSALDGMEQEVAGLQGQVQTLQAALTDAAAAAEASMQQKLEAVTRSLREREGELDSLRARLEAATEATEVATAEAAADKSAANAREAALEQELESLRQLMPVCPSAGLNADGSGPGVGDGDEIEEMRTKLEMAEAETEELRQALAMRKDELKKSKEDIALIQMVLTEKDDHAAELENERAREQALAAALAQELEAAKQALASQAAMASDLAVTARDKENGAGKVQPAESKTGAGAELADDGNKAGELIQNQQDHSECDSPQHAAIAPAHPDTMAASPGTADPSCGGVEGMGQDANIDGGSRERVSRALSALAAGAMAAPTLEHLIAAQCPLLRQLVTAQSCAFYLVLHPAAEEEHPRPRTLLRALVSARAVQQYAATMMDTVLSGQDDPELQRPAVHAPAVEEAVGAEELTHVMDLDVHPSGTGLLAAAATASGDACDGNVVLCAVPADDPRFDQDVDGAYFQRWVVGEDKSLGASVCVSVRHPSGELVGVLQVCRAADQDPFGGQEVELVCEAARIIGMRHASILLEHTSFVDALDQAARPINRALDSGQHMLTELSSLRGLLASLMAAEASAVTDNSPRKKQGITPKDSTPASGASKHGHGASGAIQAEAPPSGYGSAGGHDVTREPEQAQEVATGSSSAFATPAAGVDWGSDKGTPGSAPLPPTSPLLASAQEIPEMDEKFDVPRTARVLYDYDAVESGACVCISLS